MNIFTAVKEKVSPLEAARFYGLNVNKNGMSICPFHDDRHPSLKIDAKPGGGFYCFGCQEHGDVISLVAGLLGIRNMDAAVRIAKDFHIEYDSKENDLDHPSEEIKKKRSANDRERFAIRRRDLCKLILETLSDMREEKWQCETKAMKILEEDELYCWIVNHIDKLDASYDYLLYKSKNEVLNAIETIEEEVKNDVSEFKELCKRSKGTA